MNILIFLFLIIISVVKGDIVNKYPALDESLYENVLDAEQCHEQIRFIRRNSGLQIQFTDAGIRTPRGVAQGNFADLGNYHQCLDITHDSNEMSIQGKYCTINVPLSQDWSFPWTVGQADGQMNGQIFELDFLGVDDELIAKAKELRLRKARMLAAVGVLDNDLLRSIPSFPNMGMSFTLAVCIPKPCSTQQAISSFLFNVSAIGFQYEDGFCRLPNDKPWSPADTVAVGCRWITAAPIAVDTFFCIAGVLLVYTSVGKMNGVQLLKNLPIFYLNRLLRLFPLLATAVLLQASFFNRMSDGPYWGMVENQTNYCRSNWWLTLLHVQNFVKPLEMCIPHSWYIAIDVHLYLVSPLVLFWAVGGRRAAWAALVGGLLAVLTASTAYNFVNDFPSLTIDFRPDIMDYYLYYYFNTLTRASPFFVGMLFGYILHLHRGNKVKLSWISVAILWMCAACISTTIFFFPYFVVQPEWDYQTVNNIVNSFMRPAWAAAICWMIFACTHGYGGPVNWFLTLDIWKLPARVSYAIFIFHYPLMFVINGSAIAPIYFSGAAFTFKSLAHITLSIIVAYFATLLIDAPCSTLSKMLLEGNKKPVRPIVKNSVDIEAEKKDDSQTNGHTNE